MRSREFLEWRVWRAPTSAYEFFEIVRGTEAVGYAVACNQGRDRELADLLLLENMDVIVGALKALAEQTWISGFDSLQVQCPPTDYVVPGLRRAGSRELRRTATVVLLPCTERAQRLHAEEYFLTHADSDWI